MKGVKLWLLGIAVVVILAIVGCAPGYPIKPSVAHNIVEVTANITDSDLEDLADWCDDNDFLMLWYDFDDQPTGFDDRKTVFEQAAADKNVYANNQYAGNYGTTSLDQIEIQINSLAENLSGTLTLLLRATDILGTTYDLIINDPEKNKAEITTYVLVEFTEIESNVYKVTKVQVSGEWENFTVPKNIPVSDLANKGFAFFRIDNDKVVDARVIYP
ncbi:hypothetical protein [Thermotoga profunda]|uniref:hypothetical protein n=1 Tax=Thermotoga profunda TaxID=1508420 RepID=UPI0005978B8F|nr:hypothetical protein [Thermotoga profunda]